MCIIRQDLYAFPAPEDEPKNKDYYTFNKVYFNKEVDIISSYSRRRTVSKIQFKHEMEKIWGKMTDFVNQLLLLCYMDKLPTKRLDPK